MGIPVTLPQKQNQEHQGGTVENFNRCGRLVSRHSPFDSRTGTDEGSGDRRNDGQDGRCRHRNLCPQQAAGGHDHVPAGADRALRARRDLPVRNGVRPQARRSVLMEYIAARGYDVWLLDLRGYGKSTRPAEMADKPEANAPIVTGQTAVKDIGAADDFILQRRNIPRLNLLGWSWGTTLMATYTTQNAAKVERLVLYAPSWIRQTPSLVQAG